MNHFSPPPILWMRFIQRFGCAVKYWINIVFHMCKLFINQFSNEIGSHFKFYFFYLVYCTCRRRSCFFINQTRFFFTDTADRLCFVFVISICTRIVTTQDYWVHLNNPTLYTTIHVLGGCKYKLTHESHHIRGFKVFLKNEFLVY